MEAHVKKEEASALLVPSHRFRASGSTERGHQAGKAALSQRAHCPSISGSPFASVVSDF